MSAGMAEETALTEEAPLPVAKGDWVATKRGLIFQVGRVHDCYRMTRPDGGANVLVNVVIYDTDGNRVGRVSPRMGGTGAYEPAVPYEDWRRIEPPTFPLKLSEDHEPVAGPDGATRLRLGWSHHPTVKPKPERVKRRAPRTAAVPVRAVRTSDYDPASEAAARRLAAQELRDMARQVPDAAEGLKARAATLEAEADAISPRR